MGLLAPQKTSLLSGTTFYQKPSGLLANETFYQVQPTKPLSLQNTLTPQPTTQLSKPPIAPQPTPFDATKLGILKNTLLGIPKAAKDIFFPARGFTEEELKQAKPTVKQSLLGMPKVITEFSTIIGELAGKAPDPFFAKSILKTKAGQKLADIGQKIKDFSIPSSPEEAKAMRIGDAIVVLPIGSIKVSATGARVIAETRNTGLIFKTLKTEIPKLSDDAAEAFSRALINIDNVDDVQRILNRTEFALRSGKEAAQPTKGLIAPKAPTTKALQPLAKEAQRTELALENLDNIRGSGYEHAINEDGTLTLYHKTTPLAASNIERTGKFSANSFFADSPEAAQELAAVKKSGSKIIEVKVDPADVWFNQGTYEFEATNSLKKGSDGIYRDLDFYNKVKGEVKPQNIKIDSTIKEIRNALTSEKDNVNKLNELEMMINDTQEVLKNSLASGLNKYVSRTTGELPEVTGQQTIRSLTGSGKIVANSEFGRRGDDIITELGFENVDDAIEAFNKYKAQKQQLSALKDEIRTVKKDLVLARKVKKVTKPIKKEVMDKAKAIYDKKVAGIKDAKEILQRRRSLIKAVQKQFGLSDADLRTVTQRDIRLMSNFEFKNFLDDVRVKSEQLAEQSLARNQLKAQVIEKELNIEPLREVMKLPPVSKMTTSQLRELDKALEPYMKGDVFLSQRKLETIDRTELSGIKTYREAREILAKKLGVKPEELNNIKIGEFDRFKGFSALAEKDPFFKMMIEETSKLRLVREAEYLEMEKNLNTLARKIKTTLLQKIIPQQKNIRAWFEATDKSIVSLTKAEADVAKFMQDEWIKARDYLVKINAMNKGMKSENYFTHIRRGILEAVKEDGVITAAKEVFQQYKLDEQIFNILDTQTGSVLALDKFFRFALRRTGGLKPTENIVGAFLNYMKMFKKKQALDEIVPLIDIYAHALTPKGTTETGLLLHGNLVRFTKEWLNTQKGRRITLAAKQGGKIDWALRTGKMITTMLDIGLNIPVTIATQIGEQAITYQLLGKGRFLLAKWRAITPKGKRITSKYRNLIGKNPWSQLVEPMRKVGDRLSEGIFVLFRDANVRRNRNVMLGSLTKEEWIKETISSERLAQMKIAIGRYGVMDDAGSILGATPEAAVAKQYKTWAIPIVSSQMRNMGYMSKFLLSKGAQEGVRAKRALVETYRMLELGAFITILGYWVLNKEDDSFVGKLKQRAYIEAMTLFGATPALFSVPRLASYLADLTSSIGSILKLEKYKVTKFGDYEAGDLKGTKQIERMFTPRAIKQFQKDKIKGLSDVKEEVLNEMESGDLTVEAAKEKLINEIKKLETAEKKKRFALPFDKYKKDLAERLESGELTVDEAKEELIDYIEKNVDSFKSPDEGSFIDKVILHGKAIGTDPVTTFIFLFQGERIRKIENGTIIVERMPLEESQQERKERGATKELILDHTMPLQLGGGNGKDNLRLVSVDEWERYTIVENYLGDKLRAGLIEKKEAQKLIKEFKEGKLQEEDIINQPSSSFAESSMSQKFEDFIIPPVRDKTQSFIQNAPSKTILSYLKDLKDKIPFFESRMGKAMKEDALTSYPFTEVMKTLLRDKSFVTDTTPQFDKALWISKDEGKLKVGSPQVRYGGKSTIGTIMDYIPFGREITEKGREVGPNRIEIKGPKTYVVAHELIHAIVDKRGMLRHPSEFNKTWNSLVETDERLQAIDNVLINSGLYKGIDEFGIANERIAYLGAMLGVGGLNAFPKELRQDFRGIFQ